MPEQVAVLTALACSTNQRIVSVLLIQPPAHTICHHTKFQAVGDSFVTNGTKEQTVSKDSNHKAVFCPSPLPNHQCPSKDLNHSSHNFKSQIPFAKDRTHAGTFMI